MNACKMWTWTAGVPQKGYAEGLTPRACDSIWKWVHCRCNWVKMRSLGWAPIQHDCCLYKKRKMPCDVRNTQGEHHVMTEAETGLRQLQVRDAKDWWLLPESRKKQGRIFPYRLQREHRPADNLIQTSGLQTVRQYVSDVLSHPVCVTLF